MCFLARACIETEHIAAHKQASRFGAMDEQSRWAGSLIRPSAPHFSFMEWRSREVAFHRRLASEGRATQR
jgi:hypothetical protein